MLRRLGHFRSERQVHYSSAAARSFRGDLRRGRLLSVARCDQAPAPTFVIDLGHEGGHAGGEVVVTGTPEHIAACRTSHTGRFLSAHLRG